MTVLSKGDKVVLTESIGGWSRPIVGKGTEGVVVEAGSMCPKVKFDSVNELVEVYENEMR
jgi:hypothetical protein